MQHLLKDLLMVQYLRERNPIVNKQPQHYRPKDFGQ